MVYISGKITGNDNYMVDFEAAEDYLNSIGHTVINPAKILSNMPKSCSHEDYMKVSLALLRLCDTIFLLRNWEKSIGARKELEVALCNDYRILTQK